MEAELFNASYVLSPYAQRLKDVTPFNRLVDLSITAASTSKDAGALHALCLIPYAGSIAWVLYDYILTFPDEIQYMWSCRISLVTLLLFLLRYGALLKQVLLMCQFVPLDIFSETSYAW